MKETRDIGVLGSGPAALAVAAACSRKGASVSIIAPAPADPWRANYCLWADEVPPALYGVVEKVWDEVVAATPLGERRLPRRYAKLHTDAFQRRLTEDLRAGAARIVRGAATSLEPHADETLVHLDGGATERVRVLIDASGARTPFVRRVHGRPPAHQIAVGVFLDAPGHRFDLGRCTLMDFRPAAPDAIEPPSFLYLLPLSPNRLFLEETSLAHRPGVNPDVLRSRLEARLDQLGLSRCRRIGEEHCSIPMGLGLPVKGEHVVPFGAAASMVHPASGYSIAHVLRKAEPVAEAILDGLDADDVDQAIAAGNAAIWSPAQRTAWELYAFGLESLVSMSTDETARFFDTFFRLPLSAWSGFLAGTLDPSDLGAVMTRLFRNLPAPVRWRLVRTSVTAGAAPLARTVLQTGMR